MQLGSEFMTCEIKVLTTPWKYANHRGENWKPFYPETFSGTVIS